VLDLAWTRSIIRAIEHEFRRIAIMRTFAMSCLAALVIALGAAVVLSFVQMPAEVVYTTSSVRI